MIRATEILPAGGWSGPAADRVVLDHDRRHRRRIAMTAEGGLMFLLDLPRTTTIHDRDAIRLEDGRLIAVQAAPEPLAEITAADPHHLVRIAWHLGNRHLPTEIGGGKLRIRRDHVIEEMARGLGATVELIEAPFDPEGGAYSHEHNHGG